jgi:hypothetical protein
MNAGRAHVDRDPFETIEAIFLTALPHYLEPVEQMVDQLFAGREEEGSDGWRALLATLTSLSAAATRIGCDAVAAGLDRMAARAGFGGPPGPLRGHLLAELAAIRNTAAGAAQRVRAGRTRSRG